MLPGLRTADGALYIITTPPDPIFMIGGIAHGPVGVVFAVVGVQPTGFVNGLPYGDSGALVIAPGGVVAGYKGGLPVTDVGALVTQVNQPVSPGDAYVGGLRVGPLGGVYVVDVAPPAEYGFSNGFSSGFDIS